MISTPDGRFDGWQYELRDDILVVEWNSVDIDPQAVESELNSVTANEPISRYVSVDRTDGPMDRDLFTAIKKTTQRLAMNGIKQVAVVSEGTKGLAVRGKVKEAGLDVQRFEDEDEALDWVRA